MLNRIRQIIVVGAVPLFTLAAMGCSGGATTEPPTTAQGAGTKAPVAQNAHGPIKMVGDALGQVALRPDQRTQIEQLATEAEARHQANAGVHKALNEAIALQVEAGKIDRAALQPKIDAVTAAWDGARTADRAAFERLHGILDADQRTAFVTAMQSKFDEMKAAHKAGGDHQAKGAGGGMREWATALKLTDDQKTQIHDAMKARFQAMHAQNGADKKQHADKQHGGHHMMGAKVLEAFKGDRFVMDEVSPKVDAKQAAGKMSDHMIGMLEVAVPILTAEQRTIAATKIRTHATGSDMHAL